jgi:rod shape determining protein RodA
MIARIKSHFLKFDWIIFSAVLLLSAFGLVEIYSIALGQDVVSFLNFQKQIIAISIGLILLFAFSFVGPNILKGFNRHIYVLGVLLLILVLIFGETVRGTTGWFSFFGFSFQPAEIVKVITVLFLARFFSNSAIKMRPLKSLFLSLSGVLVFVFLLILQPDFGPTPILLALWFSILALSGVLNWRYFLMMFVPLLILFFFLWGFYFADYQKNRILVLFNPTETSMSGGYNVFQSLVAVGSGGLMGQGIGFGSQSQLKFLPEAHNDFIFAVIAEELGFLGAGLLLFFYFVLFWRLISISRKLDDDFSVFLVLGGMGLIFIEMFTNIGMNIGIVPVVGISLPFVSYGGSAIISKFILIGVIQGVVIRSKN